MKYYYYKEGQTSICPNSNEFFVERNGSGFYRYRLLGTSGDDVCSLLWQHQYHRLFPTKQYTCIPKASEFKASNGYAYIHLTSNNTIYGTQFHQIPTVDSPLIIDMSSDILSRIIDFDKIDFAYACAQKNIGPAGLSIAIVKKDFLARSNTHIPPVFNYQLLAAKNQIIIHHPFWLRIYPY
ncbi:MAG: aminotransferase class V-fold PLP-dependent enzyme [Bacteroidetes bacterium]|nr:aminotransferase class V-fold PLP-dependent enzyme [Bacteroidota bacterium]